MFWLAMGAVVGLGITGAATHDARLMWAGTALIAVVMVYALYRFVRGDE